MPKVNTPTSRRKSEQTKPNPMYIIIRLKTPNGKPIIDPAYPPTILHNTLEEARQEAFRLAGLNPNCFFAIFAMEDAAIASINPVQWVKL